MNLYYDNYFCAYLPGEYEELKAEQARIESESEWVPCHTPLVCKASPDPIEALAKISDGSKTPYEIYCDTHENTGLILEYEGKEVCVRTSAMPSLISTAGFNGPAMSRTPPEKLATVLSIGLETARGTSYILERGGKASAVVSESYERMPISEMLSICDELEDSFGPGDFTAGNISHSLTMAMWKFPTMAQKFTDDFNQRLRQAGRPPVSEMTPVVQFMSSDTSLDAAKLQTFVKASDGTLLPLGIVAVKHDGRQKTDRLEQFKDEVHGLFSRMRTELPSLIGDMLDTPIHHPRNTFVALCLYARIPQKWGGDIEGELADEFPDNCSDCTFLDIYTAMTRTITMAINSGNPLYSRRVLDLEEGIGKVARTPSKWTQYDLPGTVDWNPVKNSK